MILFMLDAQVLSLFYKITFSVMSSPLEQCPYDSRVFSNYEQIH